MFGSLCWRFDHSKLCERCAYDVMGGGKKCPSNTRVKLLIPSRFERTILGIGIQSIASGPARAAPSTMAAVINLSRLLVAEKLASASKFAAIVLMISCIALSWHGSEAAGSQNIDWQWRKGA